MLDLYPSRSLRLGMPHLNPAGINLNWLARECCDMHWCAIGLRLGVPPAEICDLSGERVFASVEHCLIEGRVDLFREGEAVCLTLTMAPSPKTGWRSRSLLSSENTENMQVDLITAFVRRAGPSNTQLVAAQMPLSEARERARSKASVTCAAEVRARAIRKAATGDDRPPHLSVKISEATDMDGVGLVYFANFLDFFERAEAMTLPPTGRPLVVSRRLIDFFGNLDAGDHLDVVGRAELVSIPPAAEVSVHSHARRRSDGKLIAVCETIRRQDGTWPADDARPGRPVPTYRGRRWEHADGDA